MLAICNVACVGRRFRSLSLKILERRLLLLKQNNKKQLEDNCLLASFMYKCFNECFVVTTIGDKFIAYLFN